MNEIKELKFLINTILPVSQFNEPEAIRKLRSHLMNNGAEINTANELINIMKNLLEDKISKIDFNQSIHIAKTLIEKQFNKKTYNNDLQQKRVKIVVGPTGAGKTTTLAKLASQAVFEYKKHVILISLDSYRLGAHAQLKSYAEILSVPFYTINTPEDLKKVVKIIPQNTEIFVDTSGISPMDGIKIKNMAGFTNGIEDASISLVVSANHQIQQMESIFARFRVTGYNNIILTKIDELNTFGHLLSLMKSQVHNFSYLTNGQEVPKDIMLFSSSFLSDKILQVV
ncbi:MAG: hypothetical protein ACD_79C00875G0002 [uncultured bacterium]|nr:MAG: hypothetical protein ACD_79C00875G0002 [uncultured bacterium]